MAKLTLNNLSDLQNENTAVTTINNNNDAIETAIENTLSRDGSTPNQMGNNLDMNGWHILNLPEPSTDNDPVRLIDLTNVSQVTNVLHTASSSSVTVGIGAKTFTVPSGLGFFAGQYILIQRSTDINTYMLARVTSYSGTTLIVNSLVSAGSGTFNNWLIDLSGPQGSTGTVYDTVTNATAATINPTLTFLPLVGSATVGDGGDGTYKREVVMPSDNGRFQSVDGSWWHLVSRSVTPEMFGCKGDGVTNDYTNFQNCLNFVAGRGGGEVSLTPNKNYRIVINSGVTDLGLILGNKTTLKLNGSQISLECAGYVYGIRLKNNTRVYGPGTIATTISTGLSATLGAEQAIWHSCITLGASYGDLGTVASPSVYAEVSDWIIDGVTFNSVRNNGQGLMCGGFGGIHHGKITNCVFPNNSTICMAIDFDWGFYGTINSGDLNTSKTNYNAGTAYTIHPHHIVVEDNFIGNLSMPTYDPGGGVFGSHGIRFSGSSDIKILNNEIGQTTFCSIYITGGDVGWEFAPTLVRRNCMRNISVQGNNILDSALGLGIYYDAFPDNVYAAVQAATYTPLFDYDGYKNNVIISGNKINTNNPGSDTFPGIRIQFTRGGDISDNYIQFFERGIEVLGNSKNVQVMNNHIFFCNKSGIYVHDTSGILVARPQFTLLKHNWVVRNCTSGSTEGNIYVGTTTHTQVEGNYIGAIDEDQSLYGLVVDNTGTYTNVIGNLVYEVKSTGTAYRFLETNNNNTIWTFRDNRYLAGTNVYLTGPDIMPVRREYSTAASGILITHAEAKRGVMAGDNTPPWGTWGIGSTILNIDAVGTGEGALTKCVATGTPGTWKRMVTLP